MACEYTYGKRGKKVCLCVFVEQWESGGIESFIFNLLTNISLSLFDIDVVASDLNKSIFTKPLQQLGINFVELSGSYKLIFENRRKFKKLLEERRYDVLHANIFQGLSLYYLKLAFDERVPKRIAHSHNTDLRRSKTKPIKMLIHNAAKNLFTRYATDLWACSETAAKFGFSRRELNQRGFKFIPNGIDVEKFQFNSTIRDEVRKKLNAENKFIIGNVGRLCDQKNQSFLLEVFAQVKTRRPDSLLLLVGEGEDYSILQEKAEKLGVFDSVIFYGTTEKPEELYQAMDVFVFPSKFEGFGIAAVEAQAAGLPVICSEYVPPEAKLFQCSTLPLDENQWTDAICRITPEKRIFDAAETVKKKFSCAQVASMIQEQYLSGVGKE
ncbi:MAG: glycosyltransferase [Synergistaceae bacterium]|nr:glycosyltransferase [Synergistaceae bacterium]